MSNVVCYPGHWMAYYIGPVVLTAGPMLVQIIIGSMLAHRWSYFVNNDSP